MNALDPILSDWRTGQFTIGEIKEKYALSDETGHAIYVSEGLTSQDIWERLPDIRAGASGREIRRLMHGQV